MQEQKQTLGGCIRTESMQLILECYLFLMCSVLPLYMKNGYYELGEAKFVLYRVLSLGTGIVLIPFFMLQKRRLQRKAVDIAAVIYGILTAVSFVLAADHKTALWGTEGWRMGALTQLLMLGFLFVFRVSFSCSRRMWEICLPGPFLVFGLGVLNRFDIYPIAALERNHSFLSTIGNINWYCGFLSLFLAIGCGLLMQEQLRIPEQIFLTVYCLIGIMSALTQGGESILLSLAALLAVLFLQGLSGRENWRSFLYLLIIGGAACEMIHLIRILFPGRYNYDTDTICSALTASHAGLILCAAAVFLMLLDMLCSTTGVRWHGEKAGKLLMRIVPYVITVLPACILIAQARGFFADGFGNARGLIWRISGEMYGSMTPLQKIFGVGQDGYGGYAYAIPQVRAALINAFGDSRLTNAHSELLTFLINQGAAGVMGFLGLIFTGAYELVQRTLQEPPSEYSVVPRIAGKQRAEWQNRRGGAFMGLLVAAAYMAGNSVSFGQITSTPYLFLFLGCALTVSRSDEL